ncbi:hypothetical protein VNO77_10715 [Canavalia gladiata]|uniref:Myb/SANT-like domain-containing protein n=1 Tax=Canavalia gladiata TaxID=3824 RepID=A0AAN9MC47_CANGL
MDSSPLPSFLGFVSTVLISQISIINNSPNRDDAIPYSGLGLSFQHCANLDSSTQRHSFSVESYITAQTMSGESASSNGNDRSRMYWTPLMERCFIELMLEHLRRGNGIGHTFNKQAWTDMLTTFNAKFGSQYDKDVLKTRYTNLWKQFNDVKILLSQFGFSWDASRQMVVADDSVWDAYVKAHPDARCYRTKPVLNFDDLCVIYGYTVADGRYSLSSHDVRFDDQVQRLHLPLGDGMGSVAVSSNERPRTDWTASMDQFFIELLLDQLGRGSKVDNGFNKSAWTDMLAMFNAKFGCQHGKRVLKNRFKKLLKCYCDVTKLLKQGFLWNEQLQMLAADDDVWNAYVKAYPHAKAYRSKTLPNYRDLELIFRNVPEDEIRNLHQEKNHEDAITGTKAFEGKGNRNPSSTDRTRTYWTPPMDRCFIDLLLEQVKHGNRLGQAFITQAWNDMITSFNERFKSQYDKDVLKNRYKHLRKQFNDVDNLLRQGGFSWDDSREMVAAEDHVWDAYTKVHPEARSLRVKTLPGYRKLCVIFGEESSDTRYIRLSHNTDPSCELPVLITGEQKNGIFAKVYYAGSAIEWTESMECCFVDLMIEQVNRGNRIGNIFNEEAWSHMVEAFSARLGLQCDKQFLIDHYFCLMKKHDDISNILSHDEFAWDEALQSIIAENDIWDAYIKDHPDAISYKNRCLYLFHNLCKIFGNKVMKVSDVKVSALEQLQLVEANDVTIEIDMDGTPGNSVVISNVDVSDQDTDRVGEIDMDGSFGNLVVSGSNEISYQVKKRLSEIDMVGTSANFYVTSNNEISNQDTERPREMDIDMTSGNLDVTCNAQTLSRDKKRPNKMDTNGTCGNSVMSGNTKIKHHFKKRPSTMPLDFRPPKKELRMKEALSEMASAVKALVNNKEEKSNNASFEDALSALQAMPDIDEELIMDACDLLEDERKAKIFLALDISLRKKWLLRKLRQ